MNTMVFSISIWQALLGILGYVGLLLFATTLDILIWRRYVKKGSQWANLVTMATLNAGFFYLLAKKSGVRFFRVEDLSFGNILLSLAAALILYLVLDRGLDPFCERLFPTSEKRFQEALSFLKKSPITALLHICMLAPITEELLMRGFVLGGLVEPFGVLVSLVVSSAIFALLHFNIVQAVSGFVAGIILGLLYLKVGFVLPCILAHGLYNFMSYTQACSAYRASP